MKQERLNQGPTLLDKLSPVLAQVREVAGDRIAQEEAARSWFEQHPESLARDLTDLALVCTLPYEERTLFTYPVVGNWLLEQISEFVPQSAHQEETLIKLKEQVAFVRFTNSHWNDDNQAHYEENLKYDELNALMLTDADGSLPIIDLMRKIDIEFSDQVGKLPRIEGYTTDLGHGLLSPLSHFWFETTWWIDQQIRNENVNPLDTTVMVVDDQAPKDWYKRLVAVGFRDIPDQQGYFTDPDVALVALMAGSYDVILTDLDLGEGKMDGVEFAKRAYEVQQAKGIPPRISAFSYDEDLLKVAEERIGRDGNEQHVFFEQVTLFNNKATFTGFHFRRRVAGELEREARFGPRV